MEAVQFILAHICAYSLQCIFVLVHICLYVIVHNGEYAIFCMYVLFIKYYFTFSLSICITVICITYVLLCIVE